MTALLQMLSTSSGKAGGVQEDALLAVSTLIEGLSAGCFQVFISTFRKLLTLYVVGFS